MTIPNYLKLPLGVARHWCCVTLVTVLLTEAVRMALLQTMGITAKFSLFYPAVMLAALYGGLRAGLLATLLSLGLASSFWLGAGINNWTNPIIFILSGAMISLIAEAMRRARTRAHEAEIKVNVALARQRDLEALRQSETRLRRLYESGLFGVIYWNMNGEITDANDKFLEMVGYDRKDLAAGRINWSRMTPPEYRPLDERSVAELKATGADKPVEKEYIRKDGTRFPIIIAAVTLDDTRLNGVAFVLDITDCHQFEAERQITIEFLQLLNVKQDTGSLVRAAVMFFQEQSGCEAVGIRLKQGDDYPYYEARGFSKEFVLVENSLCERDQDGGLQRDSVGKPYLACMCGNVIRGRFDPSKPFFTAYGSFWTNCTTELLAGTTEVDRQVPARNRCNKEGYESVALIPLIVGDDRLGLLQLNDRRRGMFPARTILFWERLAVFLSVAMAKSRAEEAIHKAKDELERRVAERTADLSKTVEALQEEVVMRIAAEGALRTRSEQLRQLASELTLAEQRERQRLALLLHDELQQLLVGAKFRLASLNRSDDETVKQVVAEAKTLLDQSIKCSRSLTSELSPPILHHGGLVPALKWLAAWMQQKHGLTVELQAEEGLVPESEDMKALLFQSVRELLFNAAKHAKAKAARVRLRRLDGHIEITVSDKGEGFDPERAFRRQGKVGGFGLFSIRERLDLLCGRLEIDSAPGRGSRFRLLAPLDASGAQEASLAAPANVRMPRIGADLASATGAACSINRKIRVLVVDDHAIVRQRLLHLLKEEPDIEVVAEAADGETAIEMVRKLLPDVVTMDINLPGMDGIKATRIIHAEFPEVCVIGLSMFEEGEHAKTLREAGAAAYVSKSGSTDAVVAAIRAHAPQN